MVRTETKKPKKGIPSEESKTFPYDNSKRTAGFADAPMYTYACHLLLAYDALNNAQPQLGPLPTEEGPIQPLPTTIPPIRLKLDAGGLWKQHDSVSVLLDDLSLLDDLGGLNADPMTEELQARIDALSPIYADADPFQDVSTDPLDPEQLYLLTKLRASPETVNPYEETPDSDNESELELQAVAPNESLYLLSARCAGPFTPESLNRMRTKLQSNEFYYVS